MGLFVMEDSAFDAPVRRESSARFAGNPVALQRVGAGLAEEHTAAPEEQHVPADALAA